MRLVTVIGARPQIIKSAVLSKVLCKESAVSEFVIHTGQHYDYEMSGLFFSQLNANTPYCNLGVNKCKSDSLSVAAMMNALEPHLHALQPDAVLVFGDTNSTLAGALSAVKNNIPVVHVEAGLRCFNLSMQEEINRVLTDSVSRLAFCPGDDSFNRLTAESASYPGRRVVKSGDILVDSMKAFRQFVASQKLPLKLPPRFVLATIHRSENVDNPGNLAEIIEGLNRINEHLPVIFSIHPRTSAKILEAGVKLHMTQIPPIGYFEILQMIVKSELVITDSGGLQREAYYLQKPSMVIRQNTEWVELIDNGYSSLSTPDAEIMLKVFEASLRSDTKIQEGLYGSGDTATIICRELLNTFH